MVASTDIKFYVHTNNNAPQLQNAYGSMINVLDACLINGIDIGAISSLTASGTTATALFSSSHNLMQYQVIKIAGANQAEFNGEHRILSIPDTQSVTFELASVPSASSATGAISASLPPLGWEKPFSSVNGGGGGKAAYRSTNLLLPSRPFLRVVDELDPAYTATYAKYAKVGIVEDMTDIDTMLGVQAPYDGTNPDKNWIGTGSGATVINGWAKWYYSYTVDIANNGGWSDVSEPIAGIRKWILVGSGDYFYILPAFTPSSAGLVCYGFGVLQECADFDTANHFLSATLNYKTATATQVIKSLTPLTSNDVATLLFQRALSQEPQYDTGAVATIQFNNVANYGTGFTDYLSAPSFHKYTPMTPIVARSANVYRGVIPGLYWLHQHQPYSDREVFEQKGVGYLAVLVGTRPAASNVFGQIVLRVK